MARPVYIRRIGHASALGLSAAEAARSLINGDRKLSQRVLLGESWPCFTMPLPEKDWLARARRALKHIADELAAGTLPEAPLFIASSSFGVGIVEATARATQTVGLESEDDVAILAGEIGSAFDNKAPPWLFSTACTSGLAALEAAFTLIGQREIDQALTLGVEFACDATFAGFSSLGLLARTEDVANNLILGEAAAGLWLASEPATDAQNWRIAACRLNIDGHAPTLPSPDGRIIADNIAAALDDAGLRPRDIDLLKPHRGGLPGADEAEAAALTRIFGENQPPEINFKHRMGHTLGACGPAELTALLALLDTPAGQARHGLPRRILFNLVGFGGNIATLVLERDSPASADERPVEKPKDIHIGKILEHRLQPASLSALARQRSAAPLRRAGPMTELIVVGVTDCLAGLPERPTMVLWGSENGARAAGDRLVSSIVLDREAPFPFDFLATQPIIAAIALQKNFPCIDNALNQPGANDPKLRWRQMRMLATAWLNAGRFERVLLGWIEPGAHEHFGQWQILELR
jgi:3-oxoacyl-[acyl-carrier-protein] synthase-1